MPYLPGGRGEPQGRPHNDKHAGLACSIEVASDEVNLWARLEGVIEDVGHRRWARTRQLGLVTMHVAAQEGDFADATARLLPEGQPHDVPRMLLEGAGPHRLEHRLRAWHGWGRREGGRDGCGRSYSGGIRGLCPTAKAATINIKWQAFKSINATGERAANN